MLVLVAGAVFLVGPGAFVLNILAGGDVKGLAGLMLFVPSEALATFAFTFSAAMIVAIALILALWRTLGSPRSGVVSLAVTEGLPMGLALALAGLALPRVVAA